MIASGIKVNSAFNNSDVEDIDSSTAKADCNGVKSLDLKTKKYISDVRITEHEYEMLRGYLHYAIEMVFKTGIAPDVDVYITAVTNVAIKGGAKYDTKYHFKFFFKLG